MIILPKRLVEREHHLWSVDTKVRFMIWLIFNTDTINKRLYTDNNNDSLS